MNKKIYAGMIAFGVAASFWACGSGDIITSDNSDQLMKVGLADVGGDSVNSDIVRYDAFKKYCPECGVVTTSSSSSKRRSSSSRTPGSNVSSSSEIIIYTSSSAGPGYNNSSSSSGNPGPVPVYSSSSSVVAKPGDPGTCGPEQPVVNRGETVTWVFTNDSKEFPNGFFLKSTFIWTTSDATPASATVSNYKGAKHEVTYAASGKHNALLHIDVNGGSSYDVTCTPVQVNGSPITGCKCIAADKKPDISVGGAWTVTGCTSAGADIIGYEWLGAVGTETSATQAFTAKNQMAAPVVNVSNNDNTVQSVQCDTVVSVDANDPDYILTESGVKIQLPKGESTLVLDLPSTWHGNDPKPATLRCDDAGGPVTITVGEETSKPDYSATLSIPIEKTINKSVIIVGLDLAAKCQIAY